MATKKAFRTFWVNGVFRSAQLAGLNYRHPDIVLCCPECRCEELAKEASIIQYGFWFNSAYHIVVCTQCDRLLWYKESQENGMAILESPRPSD